MNWLFIHRDFPGQYLHVIRDLVTRGDQVVGIGQTAFADIEGIRQFRYSRLTPGPGTHPYAREFDVAVQNGLAVAQVCEGLKAKGFVPDLILGHTGWGETFFVKDIWTDVPLLGYFEFFYRADGSDANFDPEFPPAPDIAMRLRARNAVNLVNLDAADWGHTPTAWQRDQYPPLHRNRLSIIHEGVDTDQIRPDPTARLLLAGGLRIAYGDRILTFSARSLEPYRGFHVFMRALPDVLARHPDVQVLIIGGDDVSYGLPPETTATWRERMLEEVGAAIDRSRVHFLGRLPFPQYLNILQVSSVHVYLTYPFVLSWSLLEALAVGCRVVGSRTAPVEEVIRDGENGWLVDFFDTAGLADRISDVLKMPIGRDGVGETARAGIVESYDLSRRCLPRFRMLMGELLHPRT